MKNLENYEEFKKGDFVVRKEQFIKQNGWAETCNDHNINPAAPIKITKVFGGTLTFETIAGPRWMKDYFDLALPNKQKSLKEYL